MITTVLAAGQDDSGADITAYAVQLALDLVGIVPDRVLSVTTGPTDAGELLDISPHLAGSDLLVVASAAAHGHIDATLRGLLRSLCPSQRLAGAAAFAVTVGEGPTASGVGDRELVPALRAAGATCLAPRLHVSPHPAGPAGAWMLDSGLERYVAFWRPALPTLVALAGRRRTVTSTRAVA